MLVNVWWVRNYNVNKQSWFPITFNTNRPVATVSSQRPFVQNSSFTYMTLLDIVCHNTHELAGLARSLKFCTSVEEKLYYPCSETKGADQLHVVMAQLIYAFGFAYADCRFSNAAAHQVFLSMPSMPLLING